MVFALRGSHPDRSEEWIVLGAHLDHLGVRDGKVYHGADDNASGVALLLERFKPSLGGLGLGGAISINLIFGVVLAGWLLLSGSDLPPRGMLVLLILAVILVGISMLEVFSTSREKDA